MTRTPLSHKANSWLPQGAADYAVRLQQLRSRPNNSNHVSTKHGVVELDHALSLRLLLDSRMESVWRFVSKLHDDYEWLRFLIEVQIASKGPANSELRSPTERNQDLIELNEAIVKIGRILRRYEIDINEYPISLYFDDSDFESILSQKDSEFAERGGNETSLQVYLDELKHHISRQQSLIKKPGHSEIGYQYFARRIYLYFKENTITPNHWKLLSVITNVALQIDVDSNRIRGTCQDLT